MIDSITKIIDYLSAILKTRVEEKRIIFERYIDPAFHQVSLIHTDYLQTLTKLHELIADKRFSTRKLASDLKQRRSALLPKRLYLFEEAQHLMRATFELNITKKKGFQGAAFLFAQSVRDYIVYGAPELGRSRYYWLISLLEEGNAKGRRDLEPMLKDMLKSMEIKWSAVVEAYGEAKRLCYLR